MREKLERVNKLIKKLDDEIDQINEAMLINREVECSRCEGRMTYTETKILVNGQWYCEICYVESK